MTHICSQMASFERELKGMKVCYMWHTVPHTSSSPSVPPHLWAKCHLNKHKFNTHRQRLIGQCMFSFKGKIGHSAIAHKNNNPGWVKRKEIKFYPPLGSMLNDLHQQAGMMSEPKLKWIRPREASKEAAVIDLCLITPIFLSGVIRHP